MFVAAVALAPLVACGMVDGRDDSRPRTQITTNASGESAVPSGVMSDRSFEEVFATPEEPVRIAAPLHDERTVVGEPYMIDGRAYTPAAASSLDEVGYAALLWETADGRHTANGEAYVPGAVSAAHRTLPMPSYVEVTALDTGKTILVRINDRGPLLNDRVIALSPGAARQLGLDRIDGTAAVRVRKVTPTEQDRTALRSGARVAERIEAPAGLRSALVRGLPKSPAPLTGPVRTLSVMPALAAAQPTAPVAAEPERKVVQVQHSRGARTAAPARVAPVATSAPATAPAPAPAPAPPQLLRAPPPVRVAASPAPVSSARRGGYVVQIAALSSRPRADALARSVGGYVMPTGSLFRVRTGPFPSEAAARGSLGQVRAKGYAEARLMANDAR